MPTLPFSVSPDDVEFTAIRAQGAGGQNVNKVSNAVHLRYDLRTAQLSDTLRERLLALNDQRITRDGVVVIKAQQSRSLEKNRADALARLNDLIASVATTAPPRHATRPTRGSITRRLEGKAKRANVKAARVRVRDPGE